jgi:preprotein translocase subunit SecA
MAQRDPLVEYQREGFDMFTGMLDGLKEESVGFLFNVAVEAVPAQQVGPVAEPEGLAEFATAAAAGAQQQATGTSAPATAREPAPALRAKGIDNDAPELTYTGPAEDGSAQVRGNGGGPAASGGSRRERREAARRQGRHAKAKRR